MQVKTTMGYRLTPVIKGILKRQEIECQWEYEEKATVLHHWRECPLFTATMENSTEVPQKN